MEFGRLTGYQRKVLGRLLLEMFPSAHNELNTFLLGENFPGLAILAPTQTDFDITTSQLIEKLYANGELERLFEALLREKPKAPALRELPALLRVLGPEQSEQRVTKDLHGLEAIVSGGGFNRPLVWAETLKRISRSVCRLTLSVRGGQKHGSGILVADNKVLTAFHVVEELLDGSIQAEQVEITFDYSEDFGGQVRTESAFLAPDWRGPFQLPGALPPARPLANQLDFAVLTLSAPVQGIVPLALSQAGDDSAKVVLIIQHPQGGSQKLSIGRVATDDAVQHRIRYDADTLPGSSGGLVISSSLRPIALHHFGSKGKYNQGVPLTEISAAIGAS